MFYLLSDKKFKPVPASGSKGTVIGKKIGLYHEFKWYNPHL